MEEGEENIVPLKELAHGAGIAFLFGIFGYFVMFFFKLFGARYFGPGEWGIFEMANTLLGIAILIATIGLQSAILRYIPLYKQRDKAHLTGFVSFLFKYSIISSLVMGILLFFYSEHITLFFNFPQILSKIIKILAIVLPFRAISLHLLNNIFLAEKKVFNKSFAMDFIERTILIAGLGAIILFNKELIYLIYVLALSFLGNFFYSLYIYLKKINYNLAGNKKYAVKEWLFFSAPLFISSVFSIFLSWSDNLTIGKFLPSMQLGIYAIMFSFARFLTFFQASLSQIFLPMISERYALREHNKISLIYKKAQNWNMLFVFPLSLFIIFFSNEIIFALYGRDYLIGGTVLKTLCIALTISLYFGLPSSIIMLHKKTYFISLVTIIGAIFNIILNIILIKQWGIMGAAIATSITLIVTNYFYYNYARKLEKIIINKINNIKYFFSALLAIGIAKIVQYLLPHIHMIIRIIIITLAFGFAYLALLVLTKAFEKDDIKIILLIEKRLGLNLAFVKKIISKFY